MDAVTTVTQTLGSISIDWIIFLAVAAIAAGDALRSGVARPLALSLAAGISYVVYQSVARAAFISGFLSNSDTARAGIALGILLVLFFLVYRMTDTFSITTSGIMGSLLAGIATAVIVVVIWQVLPMQALWEFGAQFKAIFGETYRLWLLLAAYGALAFVRR